MRKNLTVLMAQFNPIVGDIAKNTQEIIEIIQTHQNNHDVIIFPELTLTGYTPEDLLFRPSLFAQIERALQTIMSTTSNCHVILGYPMMEGDYCYNMACVIADGRQIALYRKQNLPNYGVFDEARYFTKGPSTPCLFTINGYTAGICICEDIWQPGPVDQLVEAGAEILFSINASPFHASKYEEREVLLREHALRGLTVFYVNQVGGQDNVVFDGQSLAMDQQGQIGARAPAFATHLQTVTLNNQHIQGDIAPLLEREALIYQALMCGLRDYVEKNHFPGVLLGLSGGIDSALTLAIAVDALGASRVHAVMLPSRYSADISKEDALKQLNLLQVEHSTLSIEPAFETLLTTLEPAFRNRAPDTTEENLQARIRGILLMALSNKTGKILLTTSNKSESAVGYATLYGDMCGGFAVLKDVLKTNVYALARFRNTVSPVIPERVIERAPSAELAFNQTDQDSLPDYDTLDAIIYAYMNERLSSEQIVAKGYKPEEVTHILNLIQRNEYKRRQSAPGVKVTTCAFNGDWRYPITSGFKL